MRLYIRSHIRCIVSCTQYYKVTEADQALRLNFMPEFTMKKLGLSRDVDGSLYQPICKHGVQDSSSKRILSCPIRKSEAAICSTAIPVILKLVPLDLPFLRLVKRSNHLYGSSGTSHPLLSITLSLTSYSCSTSVVTVST